VLEVGCGEGALATWLAARGHEVTAVDRRDAGPLPGVRFVAGDFFDFASEDPFDAVVLGASLHHLWPIGKAVAHLAELVAPGGLLVADDFDVAAPDAATAAWWRERHGHGHGHDGVDALESWRAYHRHDGEPPLHDGAAMLAALEPGGFSLRAFSRGPYLYRYRDDAELLEAERRGILEGRLVAVGLRFVAERR
jgi:SAM-dependent methyltransferase